MYDFDFDKGRKKKEKKEEKFSDSKLRHFPRKWPRQKEHKGKWSGSFIIIISNVLILDKYHGNSEVPLVLSMEPL